jgi:hypothetical protein
VTITVPNNWNGRFINITKGGTPDKISPDGCVPAGCTTPVTP